jgi:hypothetical protein
MRFFVSFRLCSRKSRRAFPLGPFKGNRRLQNKSSMPDVTPHFHTADVRGSKAESILQSIQTHTLQHVLCSTAHRNVLSTSLRLCSKAPVAAHGREHSTKYANTHCSTCSVAPPIETASQLHFGCALKAPVAWKETRAYQCTCVFKPRFTLRISTSIVLPSWR